MDIRTFRAKTMREALALVRRELGPGAAVLHSREIRRSTVGKLLYGTGVEVTASPELPVSMRPKKIMPITTSRAVGIELPSPEEINPVDTNVRQNGPIQVEPLNRIKHLDLNSQPSDPMKTGFPLLDGAAKPSEKIIDFKHQQVIEDLRKRLVDTDLASELIDTLCKQAVVDFEHADELAFDIVMEHAVQSLSAQLLIADPIAINAREDLSESDSNAKRPKTIALVGPTGVGKTTTIAKLAATLSVTHCHRVGLVTLDSYRVAAVEQLRTYAKLLNLPLEVVGNVEEIGSVMQAMHEVDVVLIDTDGRSPRDRVGIEQMQSLLEEVGVDEIHLVLAASTSQRGMAEAVRAFDSLHPTQLLLTKIDETPTLGHIVKTSHDAKLAIGYLTDGQGVPEDLAMAGAQTLARTILGA